MMTLLSSTALSTPSRISSAAADKVHAEQNLADVKRRLDEISAEMKVKDSNIETMQQRCLLLVRSKTEEDKAEYHLLESSLVQLRNDKAHLQNMQKAYVTELQTYLDYISKTSPRKRSFKTDDETLDVFWAELKAVVTEQVVVRLESPWWNIDRNGKEVFVRDCYGKLFAIIDSVVAAKKAAILTGTPGIGKTVFGYWMVAKFVQRADRKVIYGFISTDRALLSS